MASSGMGLGGSWDCLFTPQTFLHHVLARQNAEGIQSEMFPDPGAATAAGGAGTGHGHTSTGRYTHAGADSDGVHSGWSARDSVPA